MRNRMTKKMINNIPIGFEFFESIIIQYFFQNYKNIINFIDNQTLQKQFIYANIYNMSQEINYPVLRKKIADLYENIVEKNKL